MTVLEFLLPVITAFLTGGGLVAIINLFGNKSKKEKLIKDALLYLMYCNIKSQAQRYIQQGYILTDDLKVINDGYALYHSMGGNGFLDALMNNVNKLAIRRY